MTAREIVLGVSGASGQLYARTLLREFLRLGIHVHLIISHSAELVIRDELDSNAEQTDSSVEALLAGQPLSTDQVTVHNNLDLTAGPASGTFLHHGMVVCPCSMKTVGLLASGIGDTLLTRSADACLKERRRLVLVPRETPLGLVHLRNMTTLAEAGAVILPAMPGFYHKPVSIGDLSRHLALKILDSLQVPHDVAGRWCEK